MKSLKNKTIDFPLSDAGELLNKYVSAEEYDGEKTDVTVCGDAFETLKKIKDDSVNLLIVDPPYDLNKNFNGSVFKKMGTEKYAEYTQSWIDAVKPKLKRTASVYVCSDWRSSVSLAPVIDKNFILRNRITWEREKGRGAKSNWKNSMEDIFFATVSDEYVFNLQAVKQVKRVIAPYKNNGKPKDWEENENGKFRLTCPSNFWNDISVPYWSMTENTAHPTQKPEKLLAKLILASSNENDLILDIFSGSGTTGVVAKKLGRKFIDIEKNEQYCAWAEYRLSRAETDKRIQGYENGVFYARNQNIVKIK